MTTPPRIWVTRTPPQADATAERLRALGFAPVVAPVIEARAIAGARLDLAGVDALAFTSAAGLAAFAALSPRRDLPVFVVGEATAARAREAGFVHVRSADGDVAAVARLIAAVRPRPAQVLHPTARDPAADLPALLASQGVAARATSLYETVATDLAAAPADLDAVLIHSAKAARRVADLVDDALAARLALYAISTAAAEPLAQRPFRSVLVAPSPNEAALLEELGRFRP
jgi:uroporphyrinogen-III synthase